jgi:hypothetical protein
VFTVPYLKYKSYIFQVNKALKDLITASKSKEIAEDWSYIPESESSE